MLGFIKKDLLMVKSNIKFLGILLFIYIIMALEGKMDISFLLPFMSVMIMISTFSYDSYNKWDAYAATITNGRINIVKAKYLSTILVIILSTILIGGLSIAISIFKNNPNFNELLENLIGVIFGAFLIASIMYPAIYKFGIEKARIGIFIIVFGVAIIGGIITKLIDFTPLVSNISINNNILFFLLSVTMLFIVYLSYFISKRINLKKEF